MPSKAVNDAKAYNKANKKSLRGALAEYADASLIEKEGGAWERAVIENYTPMTEVQFLERIDKAIAQSKQGLGEDAHQVAADLRAEFER